MAGPSTFTFRLTAEGVDKLKRDLEALGPAGKIAFDQIKASSPQMADALEKAQKHVDATRAAIEQTAATAPRGLGAVSAAAAGVEKGFKGAVGQMRDVHGTLQLLGPLAGNVSGAFGGLVQIVGNAGDVFGALSALISKNPIAVLVAVLGAAAAAFLIFQSNADKAKVSLEAFNAAAKAGDEAIAALKKQLEGIEFPSALDKLKAEASVLAMQLGEVERAIVTAIEEAHKNAGGAIPNPEFGIPDPREIAASDPRLEDLTKRRDELQRRIREINLLQAQIARGREEFAGPNFQKIEPPGVPTPEQVDRLAEFLTQLEQQARYASMANDERLRAQAIDRAEAIARAQNTQLTEAQRQAIVDWTDAARIAADAQRELAAEQAEAARITEAVRQPVEVYGDTIARLADLLDRGAISQETFNRAVEQAQDKLEKTTQKAEELTEEQKGMRQAAGDFTRTIGRGFEDAITKGKGFSDVLKGIYQDLVRIATRVLVTKPFENSLIDLLAPSKGGPISPPGSSAGSPAGDGGGPLGGMLGSGSTGGIFGEFFTFLGGLFAGGGIMTPMGPMPLRRYAAGGVATGPQLAMFGEGSQNEAYVPLPDGRRIPVAMAGGGDTFNFTINNPRDADSFRRSRRQIEAMVHDAVGRGRRER